MRRNLSRKALLLSLTALLIIPSALSGCGSTTSDKIELTAVFNKEENTVDTVLTNNTGDATIYCNGEYKLYKQNGDEWEDASFAYATYAIETAVLPQEGENVYERSYAAYPSTNDDGNDISEAKDTQYLEAGTYKITIPLSFESTEAERTSAEAKAVFTVE